MKSFPSYKACVVFCLGFLPGCYVPIETGRQMQADLRALRTELHATRRACDLGLAAVTTRANAVEGQLAQATLSLDALGKGTRSAGAGLGSQLEQVMRVIDELRGTLEVTEHRVTLAEGQLTAAEKARTEASRAQAAEAKAREDLRTRTPRKKGDFLAEAQRLAKAGDLPGARKVWRDLINSAPKEAGSADEALIRIGDSFYREKQWEAALNEYVRLLDSFPKSANATQAYLQVGLCSAALGRSEDAVTFLSEVVKMEPRSERAKIAQKKLSELTRTPPGTPSKAQSKPAPTKNQTALKR